MNLEENQLYWLCGASSGIGFAVAEELEQKKAKLIISSRHADNMEENLKIKKPWGFISRNY